MPKGSAPDVHNYYGIQYIEGNTWAPFKIFILEKDGFFMAIHAGLSVFLELTPELPEILLENVLNKRFCRPYLLPLYQIVWQIHQQSGVG